MFWLHSFYIVTLFYNITIKNIYRICFPLDVALILCFCITQINKLIKITMITPLPQLFFTAGLLRHPCAWLEAVSWPYWGRASSTLSPSWRHKLLPSSSQQQTLPSAHTPAHFQPKCECARSCANWTPAAGVCVCVYTYKSIYILATLIRNKGTTSNKNTPFFFPEWFGTLPLSRRWPAEAVRVQICTSEL